MTTDAVNNTGDQLAQGPSPTHCADCEAEIPEARRYATQGARHCLACQSERDRDSGQVSGYAWLGGDDEPMR
jgi:RNA polymerase-binding transcription factor DksA